MAGWYYARDNQAVGPLSSAQLKELVDSGGLGPTDLVLRAGSQKWVAASAVKGLFPAALPAVQGEIGEGPAKPQAAEPPGALTCGWAGTVPVGALPLRRQARRPYELIFALVAIVAITIAYVALARNGLPRPSGLLGHGLGIVGFLMMLSTETLYSLRKHVRGFTFGRTSTWLGVHVFTGLVGPYLVLLHGAGKLNGLAGVLTLLTVVLVASGIVGRYLYTAVPRTLDGAEVAACDLQEQIAAADRRLQALGVEALAGPVPTKGWLLVLGRPLLRWRQRRRLRQALRLSGPARAQAAHLERLLAERYRLQMQIQSLAATRRLLALWHVVHVPLGVVLFTLAFVHIGAALYYATFLK
jgi:hypothetical protein